MAYFFTIFFASIVIGIPACLLPSSLYPILGASLAGAFFIPISFDVCASKVDNKTKNLYWKWLATQIIKTVNAFLESNQTYPLERI